MIPEGFEVVKGQAVAEFSPMLDYFEEFYVGVLRAGSKTVRNRPFFPPEVWSVHQRVLDGRGPADAEIEAWHRVFGYGISSHPTTSRLVDHARIEQKRTQIKMRKILAGETNKRKKEREKNDLAVIETVNNFKESGDLLEFLDIMEIQLQFDSEFYTYSSTADEVFSDVANS
jgi:hypothetical protein